MYEVIVTIVSADFAPTSSGEMFPITEVMRIEFETEDDLRNWLAQANKTCTNKEALTGPSDDF